MYGTNRMRRLALVLALAACRGETPSDPAVDGDGFPYPPPHTDVFARVGSAETFELACWNIENFPANTMTPSRVADLIASLDLDVSGVSDHLPVVLVTPLR